MSHVLQPMIQKAVRVTGKTLIFRDANVSDAEFILSLRTDEKKSRYLSATANDIEAQKAWLSRYAVAKDQAYFIIDYKNEPVGTVRLYDAQQGSFCWGSWILKDSRPRHAAMESALMVYAYAVDCLGFNACHFDVRKGNEKVWQFHERFGAVRIGETEIDYFYSLSDKSIQASLSRYANFLPDGVHVSGN